MQDLLKEAFCKDCRERVMHVQAIARSGHAMTSTQLDQIHQEFDTLYGGARAVYMPELERFFRAMASYARFLRNQLPTGIEAPVWHLLFAGIDLLQRCQEVQIDCVGHCFDDGAGLIQTMEHVMTNARAGQ